VHPRQSGHFQERKGVEFVRLSQSVKGLMTMLRRVAKMRVKYGSGGLPLVAV
jgi:hypothetical protein